MRTIKFNLTKLTGIVGTAALLLASNAPTFGMLNLGMPDPKNPPTEKIKGKMAGCLPATQQKDLDVNNVRTTILNGGDMWWNLSNARYEIPKVQPGQVSKHSLFAGALWIGGVSSGNLKLAAQTYRQSGNDFYPGPLVNGVASVTAQKCKDYDRIYRVTLRDIEALASAEDKTAIEISDDIAEWPGNGDVAIGEAAKLAPFFDANGDGKYNYLEGDYPTLNDGIEDLKNIPDMMLYIIYNDKGNIHSETQGVPIGLELHTQAFAYSTNDEINNMTFYRTTIYNRSNETIDSTVFGQWVDPDLGNYSDDYVECDVTRNLGICYNGDDNDEGILGYGLNPPSVGVNFFEGPTRPDGTEIGLTKFVYYNNDFSLTGNPSRPEHFWGYLNGRWKDGANITYGGNGRGGSDTASFMFPGNTDPAGRATWNERIAGNQPQDRRFLQTAGSFQLLPGAVNRVTIGVVWARASSGGATGSFNLLKQASDKATILFKNNFIKKVGPRAPRLEITELANKLVFKMVGTKQIENFMDTFAGPCGKTEYRFQGYQVWQLKTAAIPTNIYDNNEARLVAQFDIIDGVSRVVNSVFDPDLEENVKKIMVEGSNDGIKHTFELNKDLFETSSDQTLVNFKSYHYLIVSYASATNCASDLDQYLSSDKTLGEQELLVYSAMPHDPTPLGYKPNSTYGTGIPLTMIEGMGNGGKSLKLSEQTIAKLLEAPFYAKERLYEPGFGPVNVKIINPLKVPKAEFELVIRDLSANDRKNDTLSPSNTRWTLKNLTTGEVIQSDTTIAYNNEQIFEDWGLSVQLEQCILPGDAESPVDQSNGFLDADIQFQPGATEWLSGVIDEQNPFNNIPTLAPSFNWIRSGSTGRPEFNNAQLHDFAANGVPVDPRKNFSNMIDAKWAPYALASRWRTTSTTTLPTFGPAWDGAVGATVGPGLYSSDNPLSALHSVQVVITSDKTKWSRCIVLELGEDRNLNIGNAEKFDVRRSPSVDQNGEPDGTGTGYGWFPGYAVDLETGERLNIMFGEDSSIPGENGADMIWNPTSTLFGDNGRPVFGGKHYIYVMGSRNFVLGSGPTAVRYRGPRYDGCADYGVRLSSTPPPGSPGYLVRKRQVFSQVYYTSMAMVAAGVTMKNPWSGLVPSDVKVNIHVKRPYASFSADGVVVNDSMPVIRFNTSDLAPVISDPNDSKVAKEMLGKATVIPNPYYAYSQYEDPGNQLDVRVRIANVPARCTIQIYTQEGVVVRTIRKDDPTTTFVNWDLKNDARVPITSGIYLIHIKAGDEERVIKWFGIMRPVDYDTF